MPSLTPNSEGSESLTPAAEGAEALAALAEGAESLSALDEILRMASQLYPSQPYPGEYYPGAQGTIIGHALTPLGEATKTLTLLQES